MIEHNETGRPRERHWSDGWLGLLGAIVLCQGAGLLGVAVTGTGGESSWYQGLEKPAFTPPSWVFGPTWTALYIMMGIALHQLWRRRHQPGARTVLVLGGVQLVLNAAWTPAFFGLQSPTGGLLIIVPLLVIVIGWILLAWRVSRLAGGLLVPYALWLVYATALNFEIWRLNSA